MPSKSQKSPAKKTAAKPKTTKTSPVVSLETTNSAKLPIVKTPSLSAIKGFRPTRITYLVIILLGIILLAYYKKGWLIAATVNGFPISNYEVLSRLNQQYRTSTLNQMVNEKIILDEAKKNGVSVSNAEVDQKIADIEKNVGGAQALDSLLAQQGQDRTSLRGQIKIQVSIEKLYTNQATVSADELNKFIEENKDQLQATDSAGQIKEATDILKQQKLSQFFSKKFQELKQAAKVQIF